MVPAVLSQHLNGGHGRWPKPSTPTGLRSAEPAVKHRMPSSATVQLRGHLTGLCILLRSIRAFARTDSSQEWPGRYSWSHQSRSVATHGNTMKACSRNEATPHHSSEKLFEDLSFTAATWANRLVNCDFRVWLALPLMAPSTSLMLCPAHYGYLP